MGFIMTTSVMDMFNKMMATSFLIQINQFCISNNCSGCWTGVSPSKTLQHLGLGGGQNLTDQIKKKSSVFH
jgi:hypothetical protein